MHIPDARLVLTRTAFSTFSTWTVNRQSGSVTADISNLSLVSNLRFCQQGSSVDRGLQFIPIFRKKSPQAL